MIDSTQSNYIRGLNDWRLVLFTRLMFYWISYNSYDSWVIFTVDRRSWHSDIRTITRLYVKISQLASQIANFGSILAITTFVPVCRLLFRTWFFVGLLFYFFLWDILYSLWEFCFISSLMTCDRYGHILGEGFWRPLICLLN